MNKKDGHEPVWAAVIVVPLVVVTGIIIAYYDLEMRYAFLAIGMLGGSALIATGILGSTAAFIQYLRTRNQVVPHKFDTKPPKAESWK